MLRIPNEPPVHNQEENYCRRSNIKEKKHTVDAHWINKNPPEISRNSSKSYNMYINIGYKRDNTIFLLPWWSRGSWSVVYNRFVDVRRNSQIMMIVLLFEILPRIHRYIIRIRCVGHHLFSIILDKGACNIYGISFWLNVLQFEEKKTKKKNKNRTPKNEQKKETSHLLTRPHNTWKNQ